MTCTIVFIEQGAVRRQKRSIITSKLKNLLKMKPDMGKSETKSQTFGFSHSFKQSLRVDCTNALAWAND